MKRNFSRSRILLLACLMGVLCSCAPAEKIASPAPQSTPEPVIYAPGAGETFSLAAATATPAAKKIPQAGETALRISEVSTSGNETAKRLKGIEGDWVELVNISESAVDMARFSLSDREDHVLAFPLPAGQVQPGAYALIDLKEAPFALSPGETVYLFDTETYFYDSLALPETGDYTVGRDALGAAVCYLYATPGVANGPGYPAGEKMPPCNLTDVYISEACATGAEEWVELYNGSNAPVSLAGWRLSRDRQGSEAIALSGTLESGAYLVWENLTLPASGCTLYLIDNNGMLRDSFATGVLSKGLTSGREASSGERLFFTEQTKGALNPAAGYTGYAAEVAFSHNALYAAAPFTLTLSAPGSEIYYTLDGTAPEENGILYTAPIAVNSSVTVRAAAKKAGCLSSAAVTRHFLFEEAHTVPVICIDMAAEDFKKVYKAKERNQITEKLCSFTYYDKAGTFGMSVSCAVKAKGRGSLSYAQKSLTFKLRERFGTSFTDFPLFGPGVNEGIRYRSFCLRAGGQDYNRAIIRDTLINRAAQNTAVDAVQTQPVAVYVNNEYLGVFMLQEEMNADYYVSHYGLDKEQLDVINQNAGVRSGTLDGYTALRKYARSVKGSEEEYAKLCTMLDVEAFTDYCAVQLIVGNTDVLNQKVVESRDGKLLFRPMLFDEDSAFGSKKTDLMHPYFKSAGFTPSSGDQILCNNDVFKALYRCPTWKVKFWHRVVELLNTDFSPANLNSLIDALVAELEPEMPRQIKKYRFHASVTAWKDKVGELRSVIGARKAVIYDQLKTYFKITEADIRAFEKELGL